MPRFYCPVPLELGQQLSLPAGAARHVQVLRCQPGDTLTLFNHGPGVASAGGEYRAEVTHMGRSEVGVRITAHHPTEREAPRRVHLALGMPANERMDWLVEKATELGMASLQPLSTARTVLKLSGERADKKQAHWQSVAVAACEQCGGNRVPPIWPVARLETWLATLGQNDSGPAPANPFERAAAKPSDHTTAAHASAPPLKLLLAFGPDSQPLAQLAATLAAPEQALWVLAGPEGGLSPAEEAAARAAGFVPASLGPRVLRSETAPLAALAALQLWAAQPPMP